MEFLYLYMMIIFGIFGSIIIVLIGLLIHQFDVSSNHGEASGMVIGYGILITLALHVVAFFLRFYIVFWIELILLSGGLLITLIAAKHQEIVESFGELRQSIAKDKKKRSRQKAINEAQKLLDDR